MFYLIMVLFCISLMINDVAHPTFCDKCLFWSFAHCLIWLFLFLLLCFESSLCILDICFLLYIWFADVFSHFLVCPFIVLTMYFKRKWWILIFIVQSLIKHSENQDIEGFKITVSKLDFYVDYYPQQLQNMHNFWAQCSWAKNSDKKITLTVLQII